MKTELFQNTKNSFENISVKNLVCRHNVCAPDWGETNCIYAYNKFYYFLEGEGTLILNGDEFHPEPGELYLIPSNTVHTYFQNPEKPFLKYWCHFNIILNQGKKLTYCKETTKCKIPKATIVPIFEKLVNTDTSNDPLDVLVEKASLLEILKIFLENFDLDKILPSGTDDLENKINSYIKQNISSNITLNELANIVHLHPNYFIKYFKKHFSITPIEYVNSMKLQMATQILTNDPNKNINNVAYEVGFNDYRYFSRLFKKKYGITPLEYKKKSDPKIS